MINGFLLSVIKFITHVNISNSSFLLEYSEINTTYYTQMFQFEVPSYLEDIGIDGFIAGYDVSLDHLHHGVLQVQLPLAASHHPGVPVDLLQGESLVGADLYHASQ